MKQSKTELDVMHYLYGFVRPELGAGFFASDPPAHYTHTLYHGSQGVGFWARWQKFCRLQRRRHELRRRPA